MDSYGGHSRIRKAHRFALQQRTSDDISNVAASQPHHFSGPSPDFSHLPRDVLRNIFAAILPQSSVAVLACCSRSWRSATSDFLRGVRMLRLGKRLKKGRKGFPVNEEQALACFLAAADMGVPGAMLDAGVMLWKQGKREEGVRWLREAAEAGHVTAMGNLGMALLEQHDEEGSATCIAPEAATAQQQVSLVPSPVQQGFYASPSQCMCSARGPHTVLEEARACQQPPPPPSPQQQQQHCPQQPQQDQRLPSAPDEGNVGPHRAFSSSAHGGERPALNNGHSNANKARPPRGLLFSSSGKESNETEPQRGLGASPQQDEHVSPNVTQVAPSELCVCSWAHGGGGARLAAPTGSVSGNHSSQCARPLLSLDARSQQTSWSSPALSEALRWLLKASARGNRDAQYSLALALHHRVVCCCGERDSRSCVRLGEVAKWYRLAAEGGHPRAMFNLSKCLADGVGVPKDVGESDEWLRRAASAGHKVALEDLAALGAQGIEPQRASS